MKLPEWIYAPYSPSQFRKASRATRRMLALLLATCSSLLVSGCGSGGGSGGGDGDKVPPVVKAIRPLDGTIIGDVRTRLAFSITDDKSGVDPETIKLEINQIDKSQLTTFEGNELTVTPDPNSPWSEGSLHLNIQVSDKEGNQTNATFAYQVDPETSGTIRAIPFAGYAPLEVNFVPDVYTQTVVQKYEWDFNGDGVFDRTDTIGANQRFIYTEPGEYTAILRITDIEGTQDTDSIELSVQNQPPLVKAEALPSNGVAPLTVNFTVDVIENEGVALYEWDFDGNGSFDLSSKETGSASHTYSSVGLYQPTLRVTDILGAMTSFSAPTLIVSAGAEGVPTVTGSASPTAGEVPLTVIFSAVASDTIGEWAWDFEGDGVFDSSSEASGVASFTYNSPGLYFPRVRVTTASGAASQDALQVDVAPSLSIKLSADTIDPRIGEESIVTTTLGSDMSVSVVIEDRGGNPVNTLVPWVARKAGQYNDAWSGKSDQGAIVSEGEYRAILLYEFEGEQKRLDLATTTGGELSYLQHDDFPATFSPFAGEPLEIKYILERASEVTLFFGFEDSDTRLTTLLQRRLQGLGSHSITWNGESPSGQLIELNTGDHFLVGIQAYSLPENAIYVRNSVQLTNLSANPSIFVPGSVDVDGQLSRSKINFELSDTADVTLAVSNVESGSLVYQQSYVGLRSGRNTIEWMGKDVNGIYLAPGSYRIGVTAIASDGFRSLTNYVMQRLYY